MFGTGLLHSHRVAPGKRFFPMYFRVVFILSLIMHILGAYELAFKDSFYIRAQC